MNQDIENIHLNREDWPVVLSPDLRQQLLLGKIARAQQALDQRRKWGRKQMPTELENNLAHEQSQQ